MPRGGHRAGAGRPAVEGARRETVAALDETDPPVRVLLSDREVAQLDQLRGPRTRSAALRGLVEAAHPGPLREALAALARAQGITRPEAVRRLLRDAAHTHRDSDGRAVARIVEDTDTDTTD